MFQVTESDQHQQPLGLGAGAGPGVARAGLLASSPATSLVTASCASLHRSQSHSPVSRFSKLLRNSFSRLKSRHTAGSCARPPAKSRSVDILKKGGGCAEAETEAEDCEEDVISPIDEEMVAASRRQGLPIIPFPCPNFVILDKNLEETKVLIRENSVKDFFVSTGSSPGPRLPPSSSPLRQSDATKVNIRQRKCQL